MVSVLIAIPGAAAGGAAATPLLGDYVEVQLPTAPLERVIRLPQSALRDNDKIWVAADDNRLAIRDVTVAWREQEHVYLSDGL